VVVVGTMAVSVAHVVTGTPHAPLPVVVTQYVSDTVGAPEVAV
jgi:hypothetical protein